MYKSKITTGWTTLYLGFFIALSSPVMGQGTEVLPTITIPGATVFAPGDDTLQGTAVVGQGQRPDTATILNQEEIEKRHSAVVYDALEIQPGLNVVNRLGITGSGLSRLTIRGA